MSQNIIGSNQPNLYQQAAAPDNVGAYKPNTQNQVFPIPLVDDLWVDTANHLLKRCTAVSPYTWVSVEGGGSTLNFADQEVPSGTIDGSNVTFTLAHTPNPSGSLELYRNGVVQKGGGVDYTLSGATIAYASAPVSGDSLLAWYRF